MEPCTICDLHENLLLFQDDQIKLFRDPKPIGESHFLLAPQKHISFLWDLSHTEFDNLLETAVTLKDLLETRFGHETIIHNRTGAASGQPCHHCHLELIPFDAKKLTKRFSFSKPPTLHSDSIHRAIHQGLNELFQLKKDVQSFSFHAEQTQKVIEPLFKDIDKLFDKN
ncbi:hypothetical protein CMO92_05105 [Candidatus Woesearchaeota archaeon]|nr:hypothetical protein [Candidatus Woesearchaeota archaeon]|tara:strand:+ start:3372 stop:3878 length:507 start_codon:yes stop_codon:yes gene_type:complete